ncbi:LysR family transcriptional regulator [Burkholderia pseudomallei]|nr:LysR family transcriptional regulator [Burkholderia pseudomallei]
MSTLENMRLFVKVAEIGSFSKAARAFSLTPPQASRAVVILETRLKTRLLNRTTRHLALTEAGERYLEHCRQIIDLVDCAEAEAAGAAINPSGRLKVHTSAGFGRNYLVPKLAHYSERFPDVQIELTLAQRIPDLVDEGYDLAIVVANSLSDSTLISERIGTTYSVLCASSRYLQMRGTPHSIQDLDQHTCLQLAVPNMPAGSWIFDGPEEEMFQPSRPWPFVVNVAEALAEAIRSNMGIGPLPVSAALEGLRNGMLVRVLPNHKLSLHGIHALYPSRRHLEAKIRSFIDFIRTVVPPVLEMEEQEIGKFSPPICYQK